jgi:hypothetical protein
MGLFFLGSNASYWKIGFENNNRYMVIYKSTQGPSGADSTPTTSTWRDAARANQPENALVGQQYIGDNDNGTFPLQINYDQAQHPIWRHTILRDMLPGGSDQINGLVGWEWDARVMNQQEPAGVETFAASAVSGKILLDEGATYSVDNQPATQNSTTYRAAPNDALVVATGTNYWSRGLGKNIRDVGTPHPVVFQATVNALRDMDAAPSTPDPDPGEILTVDPGASPPNCPPPPPVDPQPTPTPDPGTPQDPGPGPGGGGGTTPPGGGTPLVGNPPPPTLKAAQLKITSIRMVGGRLVVKGTIVRTAKGKVKVTAAGRKAQATISKGRWTARLRIGRNVRRVTVKVSFPGSAGIKRAEATRKKRL